MGNTYIRLKKAGGSFYKFKVPYREWHPEVVIPNTVDRTVTGAAVVTMGPIFRRWQFVIRCNYSSDGTHGTLSDLQGILVSNTAAERTLTFEDFGGTSYTVALTSPFTSDAITPVLDSGSSYYYVPVSLEQIA